MQDVSDNLFSGHVNFIVQNFIPYMQNNMTSNSLGHNQGIARYNLFHIDNIPPLHISPWQAERQGALAD